MTYLVKDTPILKNKKLYGVGEEFPYSDKDKSLLQKGYLKAVTEPSRSEVKDGPTKKVGTPKAVEKKMTTAPKKATTTKKK
jgi:hypothetical protein